MDGTEAGQSKAGRTRPRSNLTFPHQEIPTYEDDLEAGWDALRTVGGVRLSSSVSSINPGATRQTSYGYDFKVK